MHTNIFEKKGYRQQEKKQLTTQLTLSKAQIFKHMYQADADHLYVLSRRNSLVLLLSTLISYVLQPHCSFPGMTAVTLSSVPIT